SRRLSDRVLYVQLNAVADAPKKSIAQFAKDLRADLGKTPAAHLVLDLRNNNGGDAGLADENARLADRSVDRRDFRRRADGLTAESLRQRGAVRPAALGPPGDDLVGLEPADQRTGRPHLDRPRDPRQDRGARLFRGSRPRSRADSFGDRPAEVASGL